MMIAALRTKPSFHTISSMVSLRSTSAGTAVIAASSRSKILASPIARSLMCGRRICEQQIMDLLFQPGRAAVLTRDLIDVDDFRLDPAGMRRQQQNPGTDLDRLRDRMGD